MINIQNKVYCCGCNACGDICPEQAITYKTDIEGFWYPYVDLGKCIECGLCEKVCPILHKDEYKNNGGFEKPKTHALVHKNIEVRFDSTSGGAFSAMAEEVYKHGGYVGGAVYNEDWSVSQFLSTTKSDLHKLRSSKYLQSHFDGFYKAVKKALKTQKPVLVCGSPCQMAAMYRYLQKPYDNLIIVDFICRGIASPLFFRKWIEYLEKKHNSKAVFYKAKSKELGWRKLSTRIEYANGEADIIAGDDNPWLKMQYKVPEICRPSCFECMFKGFPRTSDITIGDLWAKKGSIPQSLDGDLGTSIVFTNNEKGEEFLSRCLKKTECQDFSYETAAQGNFHLEHAVRHSSHNREEFFLDLNESFEKCIDKYIPEFNHKHCPTKTHAKNILKFIWRVYSASGWSIKTWCKNIWYNFFSKKVKTSILKGKYFIIEKNCTICISRKGRLVLDSALLFGTKRVKGSKLDSRLLIEEGGVMHIYGGDYFVGYGADIEVFKNAKLEIGGGIGSNIGLTIVCGEKISIGRNSGCGRNVTIRDNNGGHAISIRGYKDSLPVTIKEHVWLTESCTVMPGAVIETGAIISARSVVSGHIPGSCIVSGDPAKVVEKSVYWKS